VYVKRVDDKLVIQALDYLEMRNCANEQIIEAQAQRIKEQKETINRLEAEVTSLGTDNRMMRRGIAGAWKGKDRDSTQAA
jgi:hypothetical protein